MTKVTEPKVGDRVKPGPDWLYHWKHHEELSNGRQDKNTTGCGTIIDVIDTPSGLRSRVKWDSGRTLTYNTGGENSFRLAYAHDQMDLMKVLEL